MQALMQLPAPHHKQLEGAFSKARERAVHGRCVTSLASLWRPGTNEPRCGRPANLGREPRLLRLPRVQAPSGLQDSPMAKHGREGDLSEMPGGQAEKR
jgi:hypothetical protein